MIIPSTLGFVYTPFFDEVLLITKQKPESHKGKLNGLGGKCEPDESPLACIVREVQEEAGLKTRSIDWKKMGVLYWQHWQVEIFAMVYKGKKDRVKSLTSDRVAWYPVHSFPDNTISNLKWLVPLGVDVLSIAQPPQVEIQY